MSLYERNPETVGSPEITGSKECVKGISVDQLIEKEAGRCWRSFMEDDNKKHLLQADVIFIKYEQFSWDPRFKSSCFNSNKGLFHAIIKHGASFDFLGFDKISAWLEQLNKNCVELKKHNSDLLRKKIITVIRENFEQLLNLAKQLGEHTKQLLENPTTPVFLTCNNDALLVFSKIQAKKPCNVRYYMFVLADGTGLHEKFTLITAIKLRPNNFTRRILMNGVIPSCWMKYDTGQIYFSSTELLSEAGLYVCVAEEIIDSTCFDEFF